ncbi:MAG: LPS export ABC transporter permease LptG [Gammaproteobacteria bacterium]|nr:LPS export ABC transporter permease LptG [Gammaproteobacteria bacterium]
MTILDRYIGLALVRGYLLVILVLLPLFLLLDLVQQLDDIGIGDYGIADALIYEALMMPGYLVDLMPFTALLGTSIALGGLAKTSELTAMRAAGVSIWRIGLAAFKTGFLFVLLTVLVMEFITPSLQQYAIKLQSTAMSGGDLLVERHGFWIRQNNRFINVRNIHDGLVPADIHVFQFNPEGKRLETYIHSDRADTSEKKHWLYKDLVIKNFKEGTVETRREKQLAWQSYLTEKQLQVLELPIESLSPLDLYHYVRYLEASGQGTERFELVFWQKVSLPIAIGAMILLAFPFVFGSMRTSSAGKRVILATIAGIGFQLIKQLIANMGLMLDLSPLLTTLVPVAAILLLTLYMVKRVR